MLAFEAAVAGCVVDRIAVCEVLCVTDDTALRRWAAYVGRLASTLTGGRRADACLGDGRLPAGRLAISSQAVLVVTGESGDLRMPGMPSGFFDDVADAIVAAVPDSESRIAEGRAHAADPVAHAAVLDEFFTR